MNKITPEQLNKIKIIVCDLDGTLYNHKKEVSPQTIDYLIKLQAAGYTLVLATGRFYYELVALIKSLKMEQYHGYVICCNGVEVHQLTNHQVTHFDYLNQVDINHLMTLALAQHLNIRTNDENKYQLILNRWAYNLIPFIKLFTKRYPDLTFYLPNASINWSKLGKLCFLSSPRKLKRFVTTAKHLYPHQFQYYYTNPLCLEVVKTGVNKAHAVELICQKLDLSFDNVMAFGDSGNDELLLSKVSLGIVMKNGLTAVKQVTPYQTSKTNQDEGVYETLKDLLKK